MNAPVPLHETAAPPSRLRWGLRAKTAAVLLVTTVILVLIAAAIGQRLIDGTRQHLGAALARNHALLTQQRILSAVGRELALSQRLAESLLLEEWLTDEDNPGKKQRFFRESENFRRAFADQNFFVASALSRHFYFADKDSAPKATLRYTAHADNPDNAWFFSTLKKTEGHSLNVDYDKALDVTNVWINVVARTPQGQPLAIAGTGLNLSRFLAELLSTREPGITTMIVDRNGAIVAHPDTSHMEYATAGKVKTDKTIFRLVAKDSERTALTQALADATNSSNQTPSLNVRLEGQPRLLALAYIPTLDWTVVTAVDLVGSNILQPGLVAGVTIIGILLLLLLLTALTTGFDSLVLRPLTGLTASVRQIAAGQYDVRLDSKRQDELGELTRAFDTMAQRVRAHSENLERLVAERTQELAEAHRKVTDSIRYASLIQSAILPHRALQDAQGCEYFVLWRPRDVVGGDFYLYRSDGDGCLFGVVDCAGHGVPGACMTMIAHAALEVAAGDTPWNDPAALLYRTDAVARSMLPGDKKMNQIATSMDMGLCYVDLRQQTVTFAGARLSLFWSDGEDCADAPGSRRGINDRKAGSYDNVVVPLRPGRTFYLATDGLLDQAGGDKGYGFGLRRFAAWVSANASKPLAEQKEHLAATLEQYQGSYPQRDDITLLAFRFDDQR